jgi:hypothetical protein
VAAERRAGHGESGGAKMGAGRWRNRPFLQSPGMRKIRSDGGHARGTVKACGRWRGNGGQRGKRQWTWMKPAVWSTSDRRHTWGETVGGDGPWPRRRWAA